MFGDIEPSGIKKPTTVASRGFLSKLVLASTSTSGGGAYYDHQRKNLSIY